MKGLEGQWNRVGSKLESVGSRLTTAVTLPLVGIGIAAVKMSSDFETALTKVQTLADESSSNITMLKAGILELAPTVGIGPTALANALVVVESTGFHAGEALDILTASAKASAIGMGTTTDIARAITSAVNSYASVNLTAADAANMLTQAVVEGGAEATDFAANLGEVIPIAASLNVSFQEATAFIATYTKLGTSAAEATTGLKGALNTIQSPSAEARKALASVGLSAESLRQSVATQGLGGALIQLLDQLKRSPMGAADAIAAVFGNVRALSGVMATAGVQADTYRGVLDRIGNVTVTLNDRFDVWRKTTAATWSEFTTRIQVATIALGDQLAPSFSKALNASLPLLDGIAHLASAFGELPTWVQTVTIGLLAFGAAIGPLAFALGGLAKAGAALAWLANFTGIAGAIGSAAGLSAVSIGLLAAAFTSAAAAAAAFWAGWKVGSFLDNFTISGLSPSEWVTFLWNWKLGLAGISAENLKLSITSARAASSPLPTIPASPLKNMGARLPNIDEAAALLQQQLATPLGGPGGHGADESPFTKALKGLRDQLDQTRVQAQAWATHFEKDLGGVGKATTSQTESMHKALEKVIDDYGSLEKAGLGSLKALFAATTPLLKATSTISPMGSLMPALPGGGVAIGNIAAGLTPEGLLRSASAIEPLKENIESLQRSGLMSTAAMVELGNQIGELPNVVPQGTQAIKDARDSMQSFGGTVKTALLGLPGILQAAFEGGGGVIGAFKSFAVGLGTQLGELLNANIKKAIAGGTSVFNAINVKAGGAVSALAGIGAAMSGASGQASAAAAAMTGASIAVSAFGSGAVATVGGAVALGAATAGIGLAAVGAYFAIKHLLKDPEKKVNPVREQFVQLNGGLALLAEKARLAGTDLTAMLNAKTPEQYKAAIDALTGAFDFQKSAMETLTATAQKYGFTLEELGPTLQRQALGEQAATLFQDFQVLNAGGIDTTAILNRMSESVNAFVTGALRTGTEVPAAMMPMLQQFVDAGLLLDLQGNKITDLNDSGLTFATTLTEGFKSVVAAVQQLTDAITRGLGLGVSAAAAQAQTALNAIKPPDFGTTPAGSYTGNVPTIVPDTTDYGYAASGGLVTARGIQHFAGGGYVLPWRPRGTDTVPAMLTPGEMVLTPDQLPSPSWRLPNEARTTESGAEQGGGTVHIVMTLNGRVIGEEFIKDVKFNKYSAYTKLRGALGKAS